MTITAGPRHAETTRLIFGLNPLTNATMTMFAATVHRDTDWCVVDTTLERQRADGTDRDRTTADLVESFGNDPIADTFALVDSLRYRFLITAVTFAAGGDVLTVHRTGTMTVTPADRQVAVFDELSALLAARGEPRTTGAGAGVGEGRSGERAPAPRSGETVRRPHSTRALPGRRPLSR